MKRLLIMLCLAAPPVVCLDVELAGAAPVPVGELAAVPADVLALAAMTPEAGPPMGDAGPAGMIDAGAKMSPATTTPAVVVAPDANPLGFLESLFNAAKAGNWRLLSALALVGLVYVIRKFGQKALPWLGTDRGGAVSALVVGVAGSLSLALMSSAPINAAMIVNGLGLGVMAAGGFVVVKRILFPSDLKLSETEDGKLLEPDFGGKK